LTPLNSEFMSFTNSFFGFGGKIVKIRHVSICLVSLYGSLGYRSGELCSQSSHAVYYAPYVSILQQKCLGVKKKSANCGLLGSYVSGGRTRTSEPSVSTRPMNAFSSISRSILISSSRLTRSSRASDSARNRVVNASPTSSS